MEFEREKTTTFTKKDKTIVDTEIPNPHNDNYEDTKLILMYSSFTLSLQ